MLPSDVRAQNFTKMPEDTGVIREKEGSLGWPVWSLARVTCGCWDILSTPADLISPLVCLERLGTPFI